MKHLIFIFLFVVTWNEREPVPHYDGKAYSSDQGDSVVWHNQGELDYYTVEVTTHTVTLKTQEDVDAFIYLQRTLGVISPDAFNVKVNGKKP